MKREKDGNMIKMVFLALLLAAMLGMAGCGKGSVPGSTETVSAITGTWQTASIGYEDGETIQPEYYVQFTDSDINYGHMKNGAFVLDHAPVLDSSI